MQLFRPLRGILCLFLFVQTALGQTTTFDNSGRLKTIAVKPPDIVPPTNIMTEVGNKYKEEVRELLLEKVREAIRILKRKNYKKPLHDLYTRLWSDHAQVVTDYETIEQILEAGVSVTPSGRTQLFQEVFNKHLSDKAEMFRWGKINELEGVLMQKDAFLSFLTDYYNGTIAAITNAYLKKEDIIEASYYLLKQHIYVAPLLRHYRSSPTFFRKTLYDSLVNFHRDLTHTNSIFTKSQQLFAQDWFKQWLWVRGGALRINPLDFGIDTIVQKKGMDLLGVIKKENYEAQMLLEKRLDTIDYYFRASKPQFAKTYQWVNKVSLPSSRPYFQFSASGKADFNNDNIALKKNLYVDEFKRLVIHNIPSDRVAGLREDRKVIPNRSEFEAGLEGVVTELTALAKAYRDLVATPWASVGSVLFPTPKTDASSITVKTLGSLPNMGQTEFSKDARPKKRFKIELKTYRPITITGDADQDFIAELNDTLRKDGLLITDDIFTDMVKNSFGRTNISFETLSSINEQSKLIKALNDYLDYLKHQMKQALDDVANDSLYISDLIQVYHTASIPLQTKIKETEDKAYTYYSTVVQTTPVDATVENIVRPYTILAKTKTDTVFLDKFTYKIGQRKRITLSAGLAYTLVGYNQSTATEQNGTVIITNNNQLYRFIIGMNIYLFDKGLYSFDNSLGPLWSRWYFFVGVGLPKALDNLYTGLGRDLYPGLKVTAGYHFARHNSYLIQNNQIVEERLRYKPAGPFVAVTIDPSILTNALNIFKK